MFILGFTFNPNSRGCVLHMVHTIVHTWRGRGFSIFIIINVKRLPTSPKPLPRCTVQCAVCTRYYSRASKRVHRFGTTAEVIRADSTSVVPNYLVRIFDTCADYSSWHKAASVSKKRIKLGKQPQLPTFTPFKKVNLIFGLLQIPSSSS